MVSGIGTFVFLMNYYTSETNIVKYEDGDMVYHPQDKDVVWDKKECVLYYDNLLTVYLNEELSKKQEKALAHKIHGKVVTRINGTVNVIQIKVKSTDFSKLNVYAEKLKESEEVFDAFYDAPCLVTENADDKNPWSDDGKIISDKNSKKPGGNDWWAEAIGAYDAWDYIDTRKDNFSDVTMGILDNGFDTEHEDLKNEEDSNKISALDGYTKNSAADHGTHIMGIIGANNNGVGIRGIADLAKIKYVDWSPNSNKKKDKDNYVSLVNNGEYINILNRMIEQTCVINNSWGKEAIQAKVDYNFLDFFEKFEIKKVSYEEYCKAFENDCKLSARNCIDMIVKSLEKGYNKILIVQAAGNGNSLNSGVKSTLSGYYTNITQDVFNEWKNGLNDEQKKSMEKYSYESIKEHILIVGAVENKQEDDQYKMTSFSNYGENVDICAPGKDIYSTVTTKDNLLNYGKIYSKMSGTSMAAPMVSASAALLWSINPDLSAGEVKNILIETAGTAKKCQKDDTRETYPMLNIGAAVKKAAPAVKVKLEINYEIDEKGTQFQYGVISGINEYESEIWKIQTDSLICAEYGEIIQEIGIYNDRYYYEVGDTIYAIQIKDGNEIWKSEEHGTISGKVIGKDGTMYICSAWQPDFEAIDKNGETLVQINSFYSAFDWASDLKYEDDSIEVNMGNCKFGEGVMVKVNLSDYSYSLDENSVYRSFLSNKEYESDTVSMDELMYSIMDLNQDGAKELVIRGVNHDVEYDYHDNFRYLFYQIEEDGTVSLIDKIDNWQNGGDGELYYTLKEQNSLIVNTRLADRQTYKVFKIDSSGIVKDYSILRQSLDVQNTDGQYRRKYSYQKEEQSEQYTEITEQEWNEFEANLQEIKFNSI